MDTRESGFVTCVDSRWMFCCIRKERMELWSLVCKGNLDVFN